MNFSTAFPLLLVFCYFKLFTKRIPFSLCLLSAGIFSSYYSWSPWNDFNYRVSVKASIPSITRDVFIFPQVFSMNSVFLFQCPERWTKHFVVLFPKSFFRPCRYSEDHDAEVQSRWYYAKGHEYICVIASRRWDRMFQRLRESESFDEVETNHCGKRENREFFQSMKAHLPNVPLLILSRKSSFGAWRSRANSYYWLVPNSQGPLLPSFFTRIFIPVAGMVHELPLVLWILLVYETTCAGAAQKCGMTVDDLSQKGS